MPKKPNTNKTPSKGSKKDKKPTKDKLVIVGERKDDKEERAVRNKEAYVAFIRWTILTKKERKTEKQPDTQKAFAKEWEVDEATIVDWKKRGDFETLRADMFRKKLAEDVPEVMQDLRTRIAKYGMAQDVELYLAYAEGWDKKKVLEIKPPLEFGLGDVRALVAKLPADKQKEYYATIARLLADARNADDGEL